MSEKIVFKSKTSKRPPGRPRKTPIRQPTPRRGVIDKPTNPRNYIEFLYDKPLLFKKIWQFFKLTAVDKVYLLFCKDSITVWCKDHWGESNIRVKFDCNNINQYYCANELDICISSKNLELIMATIDKNYNSILILSTTDSINKNIQIILKTDIGTDESYKIELIGEIHENENDDKFNDTDYLLDFTLPCKYFKKLISDVRSFTDQITIKQESPDDPLMFEFVKHDKKVKSNIIVKKNSSIKINSKLKDDNWFSTSFKLDTVKPISAASLSEFIEISADDNKPLMFTCCMDNNTIELKVIININEDYDLNNI